MGAGWRADRSRALRYAAAAGLLVALAACSGGSGDDEPTPSAGGSTTSSGDGSPSGATSGASGTAAGGGTADAPERLTPTTSVLDWTPVPGSADVAVTLAGSWRLSVPQDGSQASVSGPRIKRPIVVDAGTEGRVTTAELSGRWALVVVSDRAEERPAVATLVDLETLRLRTLDGTSEVPTISGGTWALGEDRVLHATYGPRHAYCLASVDLPSLTSKIAWCAPRRTGFTNARLAPGGATVMAFDDQRPSCRTVGEVAGGSLVRFPGVPDCRAWEGVLLDGSRVWSVVEDEKRIEAARFYAAVGEGYVDLGPGKSGTLVACGGAAYFARDPASDDAPAQVMRWTPDEGLAVVYESPRGGPAFVGGAPRCGGDRLTVTALSSGGDEQVSARLD